jgi:hypothetical protein
LDILKTVAGGTVGLRVVNASTSANSAAMLYLGAFGASGTGDPYIYFNDDSNDWAMGSDKSDSSKFKISDNSSVGTNDRLVIDTSGNVGIGTTSPLGKLHVQRSALSGFDSHDDDDIILERTGAATVINIANDTTGYLMFSDATRHMGSIAYHHSGNSMAFRVNSTTALTLDNSQNATFAGNIISTKANGVISGSSTSTGSFGHVD